MCSALEPDANARLPTAKSDDDGGNDNGTWATDVIIIIAHT